MLKRGSCELIYVLSLLLLDNQLVGVCSGRLKKGGLIGAGTDIEKGGS